MNDTFKGQLDLEQHGGHTVRGVTARVLRRILALTAAIWHNDATSQPVMRSLLAYGDNCAITGKPGALKGASPVRREAGVIY